MTLTRNLGGGGGGGLALPKAWWNWWGLHERARHVGCWHGWDMAMHLSKHNLIGMNQPQFYCPRGHCHIQAYKQTNLGSFKLIPVTKNTNKKHPPTYIRFQRLYIAWMRCMLMCNDSLSYIWDLVLQNSHWYRCGPYERTRHMLVMNVDATCQCIFARGEAWGKSIHPSICASVC